MPGQNPSPARCPPFAAPVARRVLLGAPEAFRVVLEQVVSSAHAAEGGSNSAGGPEKLVAGLLTDLVSAFC